MRISKKNHELIRQNEKIVKKPQKHDANLQKNSTLYFQVGLIVVLLMVYGLFQMKFETTVIPASPIDYVNDDDLYAFNDVVKVYEEETTKEEIEKKRPIIFNNPVIAEDNPNVAETLGVVTEPPTTNTPISPDNLPPVLDEPDEEFVIFKKVEEAPIYPGCEKAKDNDQRKQCMSDKINKLVQKKFNGNIASEYGLTGIQRISVVFKIDKTGHVIDIQARAPHPKLQEEAERVVNKIPVMQPGMQRDKPVGVIYSLPIIFKAQN